MGQNSIVQYAEAIQTQLSSIISPVPVYSNFNRNYATQSKFVTWHLRNVHQPVYTGGNQNVKGIDRPVFQMSVFSTNMGDGMTIANTIIQSLHGYTGQFGGSGGFWISKADVIMLHHTYDNTNALHSVILDCTLDIPT
jgi:hypothetical protein